MSDIERIDQRLSAVERAVVDGDVELDRLADLAAVIEDVERLETRLEEHERRLAELEGTVDAVTGLVGNVETVNEDVERQADAAIAAVDRLEYRIDELERSLAKRERQLDDRAVGDATSETVTEPPALDSARADEQAGMSGRRSGASGDNSDSVGLVSTEQTTTDAPLGASGDVEATAETLLEPPADKVEADDGDGASSSGLGVQQAIERRLAGSDDMTDGSSSISTSSPVGPSSSDSAFSSDDDQSAESSDDEGDESSGLFTSLRAKLS